MKKGTRSLIAVLVSTLMASPNVLAYGEFNARLDCTSKVTGWGSGYSNPHDVRVDETGHHAYTVTGKVDDRHDRDHRFNCRIEHKEVVSWKVGSGRDDSDKSDKKVLAIGAGIVGLAAIAAVAAKAKSNDAEHENRRNEYSSGRRSPFEDMDFLQNECKRVVRLHLNEDHGRVDNIEFRTADLDGRNLTGRGKVFFENDHRRRIDYRCSFDRAGNIYDGSYEYRHDDDR
ncbi:MAG: hypothetical protein E6R14_03130 [Thermomicrobiales bacterium]|nr:MAG: hypothetical protein E6R14_03130 [Thermomicrobiales bacterium]